MRRDCDSNFTFSIFTPYIFVGMGPLNEKGLRPSSNLVMKSLSLVGMGPLN